MSLTYLCACGNEWQPETPEDTTCPVCGKPIGTPRSPERKHARKRRYMRRRYVTPGAGMFKGGESIAFRAVVLFLLFKEWGLWGAGVALGTVALWAVLSILVDLWDYWRFMKEAEAMQKDRSGDYEEA